MSWWDPIVDYFTGGDSGSNVLNDVTNAAGDAVSDAAVTPGLDTGNLAQDAATSYGGADKYLPAGLDTGNLAQDAATSYGGADKYLPAGLDTGAGTGTGTVGNTAAGVGTGAIGGNADKAALFSDTGYGPTGTTMSDITNGIVGGAKKAGSSLKDNPSLINAGLNLVNNLTAKTGVPGAYNTAVDVQNQGNQSAQQTAAAKTNVGNSLVNQAPFLANNALAGSMNSNAANEQALQRSLNQQGYKVGDAQYDSAMAQNRTTASQNNGTAWAQGQGQMANQEQTGAGLYTAYKPDTSAYTHLGGAEQTSQQDGNDANTAAIADAGQLFNIYSGGDTATKTPTIKNASNGTTGP
jgi:hypothetical protein